MTEPGEDHEVQESQEFVAVVDADDLWDGEMDAFDVNGREVLVVRVDGELHAYDGVCPHQSIPLVLGALDGHSLTCSGHEWEFDVRTGEGVNPRTACLARHDVKVIDGVVYVSRNAVASRAGLTGRRGAASSLSASRRSTAGGTASPPPRSHSVGSPAASPTMLTSEAAS